MPRSCCVRFEVQCSSTVEGERIGVCGSSEELGSWNPHNCLELETNDKLFPMWIAPDAVEVDPSTKYKFVILSPGNSPRWEDGSDREVPTGVPGCVRLSTRFNSRQHSLLLPEKPKSERAQEAPEPAGAEGSNCEDYEELAHPEVEVLKEKAAAEASDMNIKAVAHLDQPDCELPLEHGSPSTVITQSEMSEDMQLLPPAVATPGTSVARAPRASEVELVLLKAHGLPVEAEVDEPTPTAHEEPRRMSLSIWLAEDRHHQAPPAPGDLHKDPLLLKGDAEGSRAGSSGTQESFSVKSGPDFYNLEENDAESVDASSDTDPDDSSGGPSTDELGPNKGSSGILNKADAVVRMVRQHSCDLGGLVSTAASDRSTRLTAAGAAAGGVAVGTGGAFAGFTVGGVAGAACGVLPAVFTLGLSVPIGAALGASAGLGLGAAFGATAGAVGGGMTGYSVAKRTAVKAVA